MSFTPPPGGSDDHAVARAFGALLMAVGGLIAGLCGLCSAAVLVFAASQSLGDFAQFGLMALVIGGIPGAVGVGLFVWGRSLRKQKG